MSLTKAYAVQIAALLNSRNQLTVKYTGEQILEHANNYIYHVSESNKVVSCLEVKKVQWYQTEVLHLTVAASETRKGHAKTLLREAELISLKNGTRLLQCTIREDNTESRSLFESLGFSQVNTFNNPCSGNNVAVFQKVLTNTR